MSQVHRILRNPFYKGVIQWGEQSAKGQHKRLVTTSLFNHVQEVLRQRSYFQSRKQKHQFLLSGLIRCSKCNRFYVGETHPAKKKSYYRCHRPGGCGPCLEMNAAEKQVFDYLQDLVFPQEFVEKLVKTIEESIEGRREEREKQVTNLKARINTLEVKRDRSEEKLLQGVLNDSDFRRIRLKLDDELRQALEELDLAEERTNPRTDLLRKVCQLARSIPTAFLQSSIALKRLFIALFWEGFTAEGGEIVAAHPTKLLNALQAAHESSTEGEKNGKPKTPTKGGRALRPRKQGLSEVRIGTDWLPGKVLIRTLVQLLSDPTYVHKLECHLRQIETDNRRVALNRYA